YGVPLERSTKLSRSSDIFHAGHQCLSMLIFGGADVLSIVNRFNIIHYHDALGDACCVSHTVVYQSPGVMNAHRPLILRNTHITLTPTYLNLHYLPNIWNN
uniref:Uncharacterized protein n=1 Tax=Sinocyclocheilus rhinocerous TaxID=307959 RepID=A0A673GM73_9TELE